MKVFVVILSFVLTSFNKVSTEARVISGRAMDSNITEARPILSADRLHEIRLYDRMKCFPKVLCTLTKTGAFTKLGTISLNELADGYLRLLTAFPGGPPSNLNEEPASASAFKDDFPAGLLQSYSEDEEVEDEDNSHKFRDQKNSEESLLLNDPLLHQKERLEMKKLMDELLLEEKAEKLKEPSWTKSAISIPFKIGASLLSNVVLPYLMSDGAKSGRALELSIKNQDPISSAMIWWNSQKDAQQCSRLYPTCPFEAWEVVSMIKLIKDSSPK